MRKLLALLLAVVAVGCGGDGGTTEDAAKLADVREVAQLRTLFTERDGVPRLIILVAPT